MRVDQAIRRVNRDMVLLWAMHIVLACAVIGAMVVGKAVGISSVLLAAIPIGLWLLLAVNGMRETRTALQWPALIAAGDLEEAQRQIEGAIKRFSVLRSIKLLSLHQLAVVKMAQRKWGDALELSRAIVQHRLPKDRSMERASLLVLAQAAVQVNALQDAYAAIGRLRGMPLTLDEQLSLLVAETMYCGRLGAWKQMITSLPEKCRMAELMPTEMAARVQAWLALGAVKAGEAAWSSYLKERCDLLMTPQRLCDEEPMLAELWAAR